MMMRWIVLIGLFLISANSTFAEMKDLCPEFASLIDKQIVPELNTGIQKNLAFALQRSDDFLLSKPVTIKKDLWKKTFILQLEDRKIESDKVEVLHAELCTLFAKRMKMTLKKGDQFYLVLNPNTEAISHIMEDWTQKQVGVYKNMGLRVRWNSMTELQKSQKAFLLKTIEDAP